MSDIYHLMVTFVEPHALSKIGTSMSRPNGILNSFSSHPLRVTFLLWYFFFFSPVTLFLTCDCYQIPALMYKSRNSGTGSWAWLSHEGKAEEAS